MKKYFTLFIIFCCFKCMTGQSGILIEGLVLDKVTGSGIPYVSISYHEGRKGTVSNIDGKFQLVMSDASIEDSLVFSHITYERLSISVSSLISQSRQTIHLSQNIHKLSEIVVTGKTAKEMLRDALRNIERNFKKGKHTIKGFYRESVVHPGLDKLLYMAEGAISTSKRGYKNEPKYVPNYIHFKTKEFAVVDSGYVAEISSSYTHLDDHLYVPPIINGPLIPVSLDPLKNVQLFLSMKSENHYRYELLDANVNNGKLIYVIGFDSDPYADHLFKGKLFYDPKRKMIRRIEYEFNDTALEMHKLSHRNIKLESRKFIIEYKDVNDKAILSLVKVENEFRQYQYMHKLLHEIVYSTSEFFEKKELKLKKNRKVTSQMNFRDGLFKAGIYDWKSISIIPRTKKLSKIISNESKIKPITIQKDLSQYSKKIIKYFYKDLFETTKERGPVLFFYTADWCKPCQQMKYTTLQDKLIIALINSSFKFSFLNVENRGTKSVSQKLGLRYLPSYVVLDGNNSIIEKDYGFKTVDEFSEFLMRAKKKIKLISLYDSKVKDIHTDVIDSLHIEAEIDTLKMPEELKSLNLSPDYLNDLYQHKEEFIDSYGPSLFYSRAINNIYMSRQFDVMFNYKVNKKLSKILNDDYEDIYWFYLYDFNRNIENDFAASSRAALKFLQAIPINLVIQFEELIAYIHEHLPNSVETEELKKLVSSSPDTQLLKQYLE